MELFAVASQKAAKALNSSCQIQLVGQEYNAQVVRCMPVEARALHQQDFFLVEQIQQTASPDDPPDVDAWAAWFYTLFNTAEFRYLVDIQ